VEQLFDLMAGKTVIAIAHRFSTIAAMDRLFVLNRGKIVEEGDHEQLLRRRGLYAELWCTESFCEPLIDWIEKAPSLI
jgi:ATP-binding cassette, subfamily B, multidrug efflux pump